MTYTYIYVIVYIYIYITLCIIMGIHRFPLISNIQAAIPCGMYWNVLDLFMTWGPQRWVFDIWGDSHIVDYTGYLFCLVLCVCCLLSIGTGTQHQQKNNKMCLWRLNWWWFRCFSWPLLLGFGSMPPTKNGMLGLLTSKI